MLLAIPLVLQGCSYSYPIRATVVGGHLAFETGDRSYDCFTNIRVSSVGPLPPDPKIEAIDDLLDRGRAEQLRRIVWETDAVQTYECMGDFPMVYGAPMPEDITTVAAKILRIGQPYYVSTYGPKGTGGSGCFRINPDRRPENLPDHECVYVPPAGPPPPKGMIVATPKPDRDLASLIGPADYPASALSLREEGIVGVTLDVNEAGRVEGCLVTRTSGSAALDSATCRLLRARASFVPAIDNMGNKAPWGVDQEIVWKLPGAGGAAAPLPPGSSRQLHEVPGVPGGMASHSVSPPPVITAHSGIPATPINALPRPEETGPAQMYALTPYRGIERWLRQYPSLAACESARSRMASEQADRRLCGFGPKRPRF